MYTIGRTWSGPVMSAATCFINKYLYCTALFCTVLYKKRRLKEENEKICPQPNRHRTFQKLKSTLRGSWPILNNTLNYAIVSRHQINTCTVLYFSVLYCIKKRKFADKEYGKKERTFQKLKSTLRGSWPIVQYNTLQYIKLRYSIEAPNKYLYCTTLFCTVLYKKRRLKEENEKICPQTKNTERPFQ